MNISIECLHLRNAQQTLCLRTLFRCSSDRSSSIVCFRKCFRSSFDIFLEFSVSCSYKKQIGAHRSKFEFISARSVSF